MKLRFTVFVFIFLQTRKHLFPQSGIIASSKLNNKGAFLYWCTFIHKRRGT